MTSIRERSVQALNGRPIEHPVDLVYDWFVQNCNLDWWRLYDGHLEVIAQDFARHPVEVDSLTPWLERAMSMAECRAGAAPIDRT